MFFPILCFLTLVSGEICLERPPICVNAATFSTTQSNIISYSNSLDLDDINLLDAGLEAAIQQTLPLGYTLSDIRLTDIQIGFEGTHSQSNDLRFTWNTPYYFESQSFSFLADNLASTDLDFAIRLNNLDQESSFNQIYTLDCNGCVLGVVDTGFYSFLAFVNNPGYTAADFTFDMQWDDLEDNNYNGFLDNICFSNICYEGINEVITSDDSLINRPEYCMDNLPICLDPATLPGLINPNGPIQNYIYPGPTILMNDDSLNLNLIENEFNFPPGVGLSDVWISDIAFRLEYVHSRVLDTQLLYGNNDGIWNSWWDQVINFNVEAVNFTFRAYNEDAVGSNYVFGSNDDPNCNGCVLASFPEFWNGTIDRPLQYNADDLWWKFGFVNDGSITGIWTNFCFTRICYKVYDGSTFAPTTVTSNPTHQPTSGEASPTSQTSNPTQNPTVATINPTTNPSQETSSPTTNPTEITSEPSQNPTQSTLNPTMNPTASTTNPTTNPTQITGAPTQNPTEFTTNPTTNPSVSTINPTTNPTQITDTPTQNPSANTFQPSTNPTENTAQPSSNPTQNTINPTQNPLQQIRTTSPTFNPTTNPTIYTQVPTYGTSNPTVDTLSPTSDVSSCHDDFIICRDECTRYRGRWRRWCRNKCNIKYERCRRGKDSSDSSDSSDSNDDHGHRRSSHSNGTQMSQNEKITLIVTISLVIMGFIICILGYFVYRRRLKEPLEKNMGEVIEKIKSISVELSSKKNSRTATPTLTPSLTPVVTTTDGQAYNIKTFEPVKI